MVYIHNLSYGGQEITDQKVRDTFLHVITQRGSIIINNTNLGTDPQPHAVKQCRIRFRYIDNVGTLCDWTAKEGDTWDFAMPEIRELSYGGVDIMNRLDIMADLRKVIKDSLRYTFSDIDLGTTSNTGAPKQFSLKYSKWPGMPVSQFIVKAGQKIYFERQIVSISYGRILYDRPDVYAVFNDAFQKCYDNPKSGANVLITNDNMGGDPLVGFRKACVVEIDGWNPRAWRSQYITWKSEEGKRWPRESPDEELVGEREVRDPDGPQSLKVDPFNPITWANAVIRKVI